MHPFDMCPLKLLPISLALSLILSGCVGRQLGQFETHAARGDHEWLAAQAIVCPRRSDDVCRRLHLIKAEACFRLAEAGREAAVNYACTADELEKGLALKSSEKNEGVQADYHEKLCESLSRLQDLQPAEMNALNPDRFVEAAKALFQLAPHSLAAVYYLARANLKKVEPVLEEINAASRLPVCNRLKRSVTDVLVVMQTAKGRSDNDWERFADRYQRLAFDLGKAIQAAECR
ncbi:hypothetical protein [Desulfosarcina sp.]|uniref:hypothetical protein n=1 Tax=Desulfosarcina sp. TaxID=2027861 RepID=UPI003970966B